MAATRTQAMGEYPVRGNLAYDPNFWEKEAAMQFAGEQVLKRPTPVAAPERRTRTAGREQVRTAARPQAMSVVGLLVLATLAVMLLASYVSLHTVSAETVTLRSQLTELESTHDRLLAQYEQTFDMETIKQAAAEAGMSKPSKTQIFYVDLSGADSVELYQRSPVPMLSEAWTACKNGVLWVVEYFR